MPFDALAPLWRLLFVGRVLGWANVALSICLILWLVSYKPRFLTWLRVSAAPVVLATLWVSPIADGTLTVPLSDIEWLLLSIPIYSLLMPFVAAIVWQIDNKSFGTPAPEICSALLVQPTYLFISAYIHRKPPVEGEMLLAVALVGAAVVVGVLAGRNSTTTSGPNTQGNAGGYPFPENEIGGLKNSDQQRIWSLSPWRIARYGEWESQPILTIEGTEYGYSSVEGCIQALYRLGSEGADGEIDRAISELKEARPWFQLTSLEGQRLGPTPPKSSGATGTVGRKTLREGNASPLAKSARQTATGGSSASSNAGSGNAKGFGIAALVLAILAIFVPIYGLHITALALLFATIAASGGDRGFSTATPLISGANVFFLTPSIQLFYFRNPDSKATFLVVVFACLAAPFVAMMFSSSKTQVR